jgi:large subunit ribosomal protein L7Ae
MRMDESKVLELFELARQTGSVRKGVNETTKAIERNIAKVVIYAKDVEPPEIVMHLKPLCEEKNIPCMEVGNKKEIGKVLGINVSCASAAITDFGKGTDLAKKVLGSE